MYKKNVFIELLLPKWWLPYSHTKNSKLNGAGDPGARNDLE